MYSDSISISSSSILSRQNSQASLFSRQNSQKSFLTNSTTVTQQQQLQYQQAQQQQRNKSKKLEIINYKNIINDINRKVKVGVRCRPIFHDEIDIAKNNNFNPIVVHTNSNNFEDNVLGDVSVTLNSGRVRNFKFDYVFGSDSQQSQIFEVAALPIIDKVIEGYNGTIFAYVSICITSSRMVASCYC